MLNGLARHRVKTVLIHEYLAHRTLLHPPLGLENPTLDVFKNDPEFNTLLDDLKQKFGVARQAIREHQTACTRSWSGVANTPEA
jgi:hypothetical protein